MTEWGIHKDVSDKFMRDAIDPEGILVVAIEEMKRQVIRAIMEHDATLMEVDMLGESKVELIGRRYRHVVPPFDYEDEDGITHHSEGYECTRIEVIGRTIEKEKS